MTAEARIAHLSRPILHPASKKQSTTHHTRGEGTITNSSEGRKHRHNEEEEAWKSWSGPIGKKKTYLESDARSAPGLDMVNYDDHIRDINFLLGEPLRRSHIRM